eukprot:PLAT1211.1.p2 GENE.PLAT1211.1~~PLAT1211.1.p2  ORF type:complete len:233 (-),score=109.62 PLAT1211.1:191-889(-)
MLRPARFAPLQQLVAEAAAPTRAVELLLVRHGQSQANRRGRLAGWADAELTEKGRQQALSLAPTFGELHLDSTHCSDLSRASETAELALSDVASKAVEEGAAALLPPTPSIHLRELYFGWMENVAWDAVSPSERAMLDDLPRAGPPGGEKWMDLQARALRFVHRLPTGRHALFTHGGLVRMLRTHWEPDNAHATAILPNASVTRVRLCGETRRVQSVDVFVADEAEARAVKM